ncbi:beta family protein [Pseudomonas syringae group sp. J254-4]|uniref:beta family protein n=1 Tax=Pseudomonas syringae group sp. J254-4 TaxID=3079589 RepID=UPI002911F1EF|nr:hypothetical protein [Pseudomonas syringae group sp. J254-4]MDU8458155.1 hypothetical protein [Pseudomonas syringae group sp. J254-4]
MAKFPKHPQYMPVIKWQSWEQRALEKVDAELKPRMRPCIEVRTSKQHLNLLSKLQTVWPHDVLVDYSNPSGLLSHVRQSELLDFMQHAVQQKIPASPIIGPAYVANMGAKFLKLAASLPGVGIRLRLGALAVPNDKLQLAKGAYAYLKAAGINTTLIVDLGVSPKEWSPAQVTSFGHDLNSLAAIGYQSMHLVSGAYPASLASVKTGSATFQRSDWRFWYDVNANVPNLGLGFGDYGTLSPEWTEEILERRSNRIAIRYTRGVDWLILRADGKTTNDSVAISEILVNTYPKDFKGAPYSFGDQILSERADPTVPVKQKRCGHYHITEGWSHHIAYVLKEQY